MYWIYDIPNWQLCLLMIALFDFVSILGFFLTRPLMRWITKASDRRNDVVSWYFSGVGVLYGLTLGLIAVGTWQNYSDVDAKVSKEADSLEALYRDLDGYPADLRWETERLLRDYAQVVIAKEWPAHRLGQTPDDGDEDLEEFENLIMSFEPTTETMKLAHSEVIKSLTEVVRDRGYRMQSVGTALPGVLWTVVLLGAVLNVVMTYLFWVENNRLHVALIGFLSTALAMLIFLTAAMDNPFRGDFSVSADAYQYVLDHVMNRPGKSIDPSSAAEAAPDAAAEVDTDRTRQ